MEKYHQTLKVSLQFGVFSLNTIQVQLLLNKVIQAKPNQTILSDTFISLSQHLATAYLTLKNTSSAQITATGAF